MVDSLPPPSFRGPTIAQAHAAKAPALMSHSPAPKKTPQVTVAGIPREWIPPATAEKREWNWIVVHHSATPTGGAAAFDRMHRDKGWDELGYDFVIGNGTDTGNGEIEVGPRWIKQKYGAHAKTPDNRFNEHGIGICLVGNFDVSRPQPQQMKALAKLVSYLMKTYHITPDRVLGHGDTKATDCPGRNLNVAEVRRMATQMLADAGEPAEEPTRTASGELLFQDAR
jgi:hypothetical protein